MINSNEVSPKGSVWQDGLGRTSIRASQILLVMALLGVGLLALTKVTLVVIPFLLALILAAAISPLVKILINKGMPAVLATSISFVGLLVVFGGILFGIVIAVKNEWAGLVQHATEGFDKVYAYAQDGPLPIDDKLISDVKNTAVNFLTSSSFGNGALSGISAATSFATGLVLLVVILFFLLKDGSQMWSFFLGFLSGKTHDKAVLVGNRTMDILGGYVRGTAIVAAVDAICIGVVLAILDVPLALPLAVLTFVGAFIPLVGATAAGAFAVLIALVSNDVNTAIIVLIVVIAVNQLEGNFLQPVVMGNALSVHGLVILLALTVGTVLAGIVGAILSVPITAVVWGAIKVWRDPLPNVDDAMIPDGGNSNVAVTSPVATTSNENGTAVEVDETIGNNVDTLITEVPSEVATVISDVVNGDGMDAESLGDSNVTVASNVANDEVTITVEEPTVGISPEVLPEVAHGNDSVDDDLVDNDIMVASSTVAPGGKALKFDEAEIKAEEASQNAVPKVEAPKHEAEATVPVAPGGKALKFDEAEVKAKATVPIVIPEDEV